MRQNIAVLVTGPAASRVVSVASANTFFCRFPAVLPLAVIAVRRRALIFFVVFVTSFAAVAATGAWSIMRTGVGFVTRPSPSGGPGVPLPNHFVLVTVGGFGAIVIWPFMANIGECGPIPAVTAVCVFFPSHAIRFFVIVFFLTSGNTIEFITVV